MDTQKMTEIARLLYEMPLATTCAVLILFIVSLAGYIVYLHRSNTKAEREDTKVKHLLASHISQLSSRIGRVMKGLETHGYTIPEDIEDDDDATILLTNMLNGKKKKKK